MCIRDRLKAIENGYRPIVLERGKDVRERRRAQAGFLLPAAVRIGDCLLYTSRLCVRQVRLQR